MRPIIILDRVTERMRIDVGRGCVRILREYQIMPEGSWHVDPESGITFGQEYTREVIEALRSTSDMFGEAGEKA